LQVSGVRTFPNVSSSLVPLQQMNVEVANEPAFIWYIDSKHNVARLGPTAIIFVEGIYMAILLNASPVRTYLRALLIDEMQVASYHLKFTLRSNEG